MSDTRHRNVNWTIERNPMSNNVSFDGAQLAVLMDIRDELEALNAKLYGIGPTVHGIERYTRTTARNTSRARCPRCPRVFDSSRGRDQHIRLAHP